MAVETFLWQHPTTERYKHWPLQPTHNGAVISDTNPDRYKRPPHPLWQWIFFFGPAVDCFSRRNISELFTRTESWKYRDGTGLSYYFHLFKRGYRTTTRTTTTTTTTTITTIRLYSIYTCIYMLMHFQCYEYTTTTLGIHWNDYEFTGLRQRLPLRLRQRTVGNIAGPRGQRGTLPPDPHEKHSTALVALASPAKATPSSKRKNQGKNQKEPKYFCWICWDWGQVRFSEPSYTSNAQVWIHGLDQSFDFAVCSRRHICQVQIQKGIHLARYEATCWNQNVENMMGLTTFGRSHAEQIGRPKVAPTTCPSQNIKKLGLSDHFSRGR